MKLYKQGRLRTPFEKWTPEEAKEIFVLKTATPEEVRARYRDNDTPGDMVVSSPAPVIVSDIEIEDEEMEGLRNKIIDLGFPEKAKIKDKDTLKALIFDLESNPTVIPPQDEIDKEEELEELRAEAKSLSIPGYAKMKKETLIARIEEKE